MKKRLNIFCVCMIAAFLLSVSGNVYLIIEMFINGVEVGMKAAQGEITEIPQYKMVHVLPTDMIETTGTVTNLKDGRQLAVKPIMALVECPYSHSSHGFEVLQGLIGFIVIIGFVYATVYFAKLMIHINRNIVFDWSNVKHLRRVGWSLTGMCALSFISVWISNHQLAQCIELAGSKLNILIAFSDSTLILGFITLLASEVFAIGLRLKEENELTI